MHKQPGIAVMHVTFLLLLLLTFVVQYFVPPIIALLIVLLPWAVWIHFYGKRFECPYCHKNLGRFIRHLSRCPNCGNELHEE